jgi:hypothetical protein
MLFSGMRRRVAFAAFQLPVTANIARSLLIFVTLMMDAIHSPEM